MPRLARAVLPEVPHHLTQRGINRQDIFFTDDQRATYLRLAGVSLPLFGVRVWAYCLMSNHVHWVVVPPNDPSLAQAFGFLHGRYAQHTNTALGRSGHFWQNRFFSCALDEAHTWTALRYVERNPVRAGLVELAEQWPWSSASARLTAVSATPLPLDLQPWRECFTTDQWRSLLASEDADEGERQLRINTYTGRPVGAQDFVQNAEKIKRRLRPAKGGRPRKLVDEACQGDLFASDKG